MMCVPHNWKEWNFMIAVWNITWLLSHHPCTSGKAYLVMASLSGQLFSTVAPPLLLVYSKMRHNCPGFRQTASSCSTYFCSSSWKLFFLFLFWWKFSSLAWDPYEENGMPAPHHHRCIPLHLCCSTSWGFPGLVPAQFGRWHQKVHSQRLPHSAKNSHP